MSKYDAWAAQQAPPQAPAATAGKYDAWAQAQEPPAELGGSDEQFAANALASKEAPGAALEGFPALGAVGGKSQLPQSVRAQASFKGTKTGVYNYLVKKYGADAVEPVVEQEGGTGLLTHAAMLAKTGQAPAVGSGAKPVVVNFKVRLPDGSVALLDPKGPDRGDFTDLAADAVEVVPAMIGGAIGGAGAAAAGGPAGIFTGLKGAMVGAGVGAAAGSAAKQFIGANLIPGEENMTAGDRLLSGGANVVGNVIGEPIGRAVSAAVAPAFSPVRAFLGRRAASKSVEAGGSALERNIARDAVEPLAKEAAGDVVPKFSMVPDAPTPSPVRLPGDPGVAADVAMIPAREAATEGARLSDKIGYPLTPGQLAQNPEQISLEQVVRQLPGGKNKMLAGDVGRATALQNYVHNSLEKTFGAEVGATTAVNNFGIARKAMMEHMSDIMASSASRGFGDAIKMARNEKIVPIPRALAAIDSLIGEQEGALTGRGAFGDDGDSAGLIVKALQKKRNELVGELDRTVAGWTQDAPLEIGPYGTRARMMTGESVPVKVGKGGNTPQITIPDRVVPGRPEDVRVTVGKLQVDLRNLGKAAAGSGKFINTGDHSLDRRIAAKVFGALKDDLSAAADSTDPVLAGPAQGLKSARDAYREMSKAMEAEDDLLFDRAIKLIDKGDDPGKLIGELANGKSFTPNQIARTMGTLNEISPDAARQFAGAAVRAKLESTAPRATSAMAQRGVTISPAQLANMAQKDTRWFKAIFHGNEQAFNDFMDAAKYGARIGDDANMTGSQTAPFQAFQALIEAFAGGVAEPIKLGKTIALRMRAADLADTFNNREASRIFLGLAAPKRSLTREQIAAGAMRIKNLVERDRQLFSDLPQGEDMQPPSQPQQQAPPRNIATIGAAE